MEKADGRSFDVHLSVPNDRDLFATNYFPHIKSVTSKTVVDKQCL